MNVAGGEPLSEDDLIAMEMRASEATCGPWISYVEGREMMSGSSFIQTDAQDIYLTGATERDQDFIAFARADVPRLILEVRRLRRIEGEPT